MSGLTPEEKKAKLWKYVGYRGFCEFLDSDNDFFILRRFGALSARILLALQDELVQFEDELTDLETQFQQVLSRDVHNGSFRRDLLPDRRRLIEQIQLKLRDYSKSPLIDRRKRWHFFARFQ